MRNLICIGIVLLVVSCKMEKSQQTTSNSESVQEKMELDWLVGNWIRVGEKEGNQTYEYWNRRDINTLVGMGCTMKNTDTIWREDVLLIKRNGGWNFEVTGLGATSATIFKVTSLEADKFVCENELNEFPKKIEYAFDGTNINAVISGGGPTIPFNFVPLKH